MQFRERDAVADRSGRGRKPLEGEPIRAFPILQRVADDLLPQRRERVIARRVRVVLHERNRVRGRVPEHEPAHQQTNRARRVGIRLGDLPDEIQFVLVGAAFRRPLPPQAQHRVEPSGFRWCRLEQRDDHARGVVCQPASEQLPAEYGAEQIAIGDDLPEPASGGGDRFLIRCGPVGPVQREHRGVDPLVPRVGIERPLERVPRGFRVAQQGRERRALEQRIHGADRGVIGRRGERRVRRTEALHGAERERPRHRVIAESLDRGVGARPVAQFRREAGAQRELRWLVRLGEPAQHRLRAFDRAAIRVHQREFAQQHQPAAVGSDRPLDRIDEPRGEPASSRQRRRRVRGEAGARAGQFPRPAEGRLRILPSKGFKAVADQRLPARRTQRCVGREFAFEQADRIARREARGAGRDQSSPTGRRSPIVDRCERVGEGVPRADQPGEFGERRGSCRRDTGSLADFLEEDERGARVVPAPAERIDQAFLDRWGTRDRARGFVRPDRVGFVSEGEPGIPEAHEQRRSPTLQRRGFTPEIRRDPRHIRDLDADREGIGARGGVAQVEQGFAQRRGGDEGHERVRVGRIGAQGAEEPPRGAGGLPALSGVQTREGEPLGLVEPQFRGTRIGKPRGVLEPCGTPRVSQRAPDGGRTRIEDRRPLEHRDRVRRVAAREGLARARVQRQRFALFLSAGRREIALRFWVRRARTVGRFGLGCRIRLGDQCRRVQFCKRCERSLGAGVRFADRRENRVGRGEVP